MIEPTQEVVTGRLRFSGLAATELSKYASIQPEWLVDGLFTVDEPILLGARSKCCKTLTLSDLAVGIASGTNFLGAFKIPKWRRVMFISGEANNRRMAGHLERACKARGRTLPELEGWLRVETMAFPQLPSVSDRADVSRLVKELGIEVVIVDPLYRGICGLDLNRLSDMGPAIKEFQAACYPATMIVSHHGVKASAREYGKPPGLEDMTGAGIAESFGQWWLIGRNSEYGCDSQHDLCVQFGGREGQAGLRRILFNEQQWTFDITDLGEFREASRATQDSEKSRAKRESREVKLSDAREKIIAACRGAETPLARTRIRDLSGQSGITFETGFTSLILDGTIVMRPYRDGANRLKGDGYILSEYASDHGEKLSGKIPKKKRSAKMPDSGLSRITDYNPA